MTCTDASPTSTATPRRRVTIVIPTLSRPEPLRRALASALAQELSSAAALDVVVVDNSPEGDARERVEAVAAGAATPVAYVSEPSPGVATARNRGVAEATGDWIAFLDDDEEASPGWIAALLSAAERAGADAAFGPVEAKAEPGAALAGFDRYFGRRFSCSDGTDITRAAAHLGTNNSMFHRARCFPKPRPFEESLNETGGEDSLALERLRRRGRRFVWAAEARVTEWIPARRLTWPYVWRRKFLSGQIRTFVQRMAEPPRWRRVALWMAVGLVQAAVGGAAAALLWPVDREAARRKAGLACGGLGKVLWMGRFRPGLYGRGLVS